MAATGLGWLLFVAAHLVGNLLLLSDNPDSFNAYAHRLTSLGPLLVAAELVLVVALVAHVISAVTVTIGSWRARPQAYEVYKGRGGPSRRTVSSRTMIWTGLALAIFLPVHVYTLKYGPGIEQGYVALLDGEQIRDLRRLVVETFGNPWYTAWYVGTMAFLGFHLRHGFWSAFQSLGLYHPRLTPVAYAAGLVCGVMLAFGFLFIPIWVFATGGSL
jgi:succinate dehydrogenase / fumarate reductase cytochrome b subunit